MTVGTKDAINISKQRVVERKADAEIWILNVEVEFKNLPLRL